jgi:hypothetical protein
MKNAENKESLENLSLRIYNLENKFAALDSYTLILSKTLTALSSRLVKLESTVQDVACTTNNSHASLKEEIRLVAEALVSFSTASTKNAEAVRSVLAEIIKNLGDQKNV